MGVRVSIILVSYNSRADLKQCLPALLPGLSPLDEVIVVDNASSDGCAGWLLNSYPQVRLVRSDKNLGFAGGNNLAARHAQGIYLAFLNPDTLVEPGWLDALISALEHDPAIGLATSKILMLEQPDLINTCGNETHISGITLCRGVGQPRHAFDRSERVNSVSGAAFIIRRDLFERLGGFDDALFLYMEDTDLSLRARLAGYHSSLVPASIIYHRYKLRFGPRKVYYQERNRYRILLKLLQANTLLRLLPVLILAEMVTWGFVILREPLRFMNKLRAYAYVLTHLGDISRRRQAVQALRAISDQQLLSEWHTSLGFDQTGSTLITWLAAKVFDPLFSFFHRQAVSPPPLLPQDGSAR